MKEQAIQNQKKGGSALMTTVVVLGLVVSVAVVVSGILVSKININKDLGDSLTAVYAADTGIESALYYIRVEGNIPPNNTTEVALTSVNVFIDSTGDIAHAEVKIPANGSTNASVRLESTGVYKQTYRAFEVTQPKF